MSRPKSRTEEDLVCTRCGCLCDDLRVTTSGGQVERVENACELAKDWFLAQSAGGDTEAEIEGVPCSYEQAIGRAAQILASARAPLIYGLSDSCTAGQRAATRLADRLGGLIDTTASQCHAPSIMAIQSVGESTCTLGEARHRCDLVLFWGCDPTVTHPRHGERYSIEPWGMQVPGGRSDRQIVVIDAQPNATASLADKFLQLKMERDFELIWELRYLLRGQQLSTSQSGLPVSEVKALANQLRSCRSGIVYFGLGIARANMGHLVVEGLLRLVCDLNAETRFYARRLRVPGDVVGADSVLCWQTGYPFAVNLNRGYPRYSPGEYSADIALTRGEVDACILVGTGAKSELSRSARANLEQVPTIELVSMGTAKEAHVPTIRFTTAIAGVHTTGTVYRMDEIPISARQFLPSRLKTDSEILRDVSQAVASI